MAASFDGAGKLSLGQTLSVARHSYTDKENHRQGSGHAGFSAVAEPSVSPTRKSQGALDRAVGASGDTQQSPYCPEGARLSFPATLGPHVRTGERRIDTISAGGTVSVP